MEKLKIFQESCRKAVLFCVRHVKAASFVKKAESFHVLAAEKLDILYSIKSWIIKVKYAAFGAVENLPNFSTGQRHEIYYPQK